MTQPNHKPSVDLSALLPHIRAQHELLASLYPGANLTTDEIFLIGAEIGSDVMPAIFRAVANIAHIHREGTLDPAVARQPSLNNDDRDAICLALISFLIGCNASMSTEAIEGNLTAECLKTLDAQTSFFRHSAVGLVSETQAFADKRKQEIAEAEQALAATSTKH